MMYRTLVLMSLLGAVQCWLLPATALAINGYQPGDRLHVLALSGLRLRAQPGASEAVTATIPYAARVEVLPQQLRVKAFEAEGIKGFWVKVRYEKQDGWVFDGFLSHLPAPASSTDDLLKYAQMYGVPVTPMMTSRVDQREETLSEGRVQVFKQAGGNNSKVWCYNSEGYYEAYAEYLCIEGGSAEEAWLLAKAIFRQQLTAEQLSCAFRSVGTFSDGSARNYIISETEDTPYLKISVYTDHQGQYTCIAIEGGV